MVASACPRIVRWPGHIKPGTVENGIFSGLDWFPTLAAAAGNPNITDQLLKGVKLGDRTIRTISTDTTRWICSQGKAHPSGTSSFTSAARAWGRFASMTSSSSSTSSLRAGRAKKSPPICRSWSTFGRIRLSARQIHSGQSLNDWALGYMNDFYAREFWRFVLVQQDVAKLASTAIEFPPMQDPASFNLEAVKAKVEEMIKQHEGQ